MGDLGVLSGDELRQVLEPATWGVPGPRPTRPPQTVRSLLGVAHACAKHLLPAFGFHECYAELKANAMRGDALTEDELEFVGATSLWHDTSGGWRQFADSAFELDAILSAEDTALLQSLMMVCHADRAVARVDGRPGATSPIRCRRGCGRSRGRPCGVISASRSRCSRPVRRHGSTSGRGQSKLWPLFRLHVARP